MVRFTEGSPLVVIGENNIDQFSQLGGLDQRFLNKTAIIPSGSMLFHQSLALRELLSRGKFDYITSNHDGAFFFTDVPGVHTNCTITVPNDLVMYISGQLTLEDKMRLRTLGDGDNWLGAFRSGFDGRVAQNDDVVALRADGTYGTEILVFKDSLQKLGKIAAYPKGSESEIFRFFSQRGTN